MPTVSIVGGETLLGREVKDRLKDSTVVARIEMLGAVDSAGVLTDVEGEPTVLTPVDAERVHESDVIVCAADPASAKRVHELAKGSVRLLDLTGGLEDLPNARLRSPLVEVDDVAAEPDTVQVVAHPAASALAAVLTRVHNAYPIRRAIVIVFEPASERGQAGITELQQQVSSLLSFRPLEKRVFDAQIGFNLLPAYGEEAPLSLSQIESRVNSHLATLLRGSVPLPSLRVVQAPVFHGHSFSIWVEFQTRPSPTDLGAALASAQIEVRGSDLEAPTNVGTAGQSGVTVGVIEPDVNQPSAMWLWAVADNYRVVSDDTVATIRSLLGSSAK